MGEPPTETDESGARGKENYSNVQSYYSLLWEKLLGNLYGIRKWNRYTFAEARYQQRKKNTHSNHSVKDKQIILF